MPGKGRPSCLPGSTFHLSCALWTFLLFLRAYIPYGTSNFDVKMLFDEFFSEISGPYFAPAACVKTPVQVRYRTHENEYKYCTSIYRQSHSQRVSVPIYDSCVLAPSFYGYGYLYCILIEENDYHNSFFSGGSLSRSSQPRAQGARPRCRREDKEELRHTAQYG